MHWYFLNKINKYIYFLNHEFIIIIIIYSLFHIEISKLSHEFLNQSKNL
jgi:hypothetical protein